MNEDKNLTYTEFRKRIGDVKHPQYWRSLDEAMRSDVFDDFMHDEFPRQAAALTPGVDRRAGGPRRCELQARDSRESLPQHDCHVTVLGRRERASCVVR